MVDDLGTGFGGTPAEINYDVAVGTGNLYAGGRTFNRPRLTKHDGAGEILWSREINMSNPFFFPTVAAVEVDAAGNAYMSGYTEGSLVGPSAGGFDAFLIKHDSTGNHLWSRQVGTISDDQGLGMAVDASGNAISVGGP